MEMALAKLDAVQFYLDLQKRNDVAACASLFMAAIAPFGFDTFAYGEIDLSDREICVFHIVEWPEAFLKMYVRTGLADGDFVLDVALERRSPFTWSELRRDPKLTQTSRDLMRLVAEHGWTEGLCVPLARGGARFALASLVGRRRLASTGARDLLCVISELLVSRVRALGAPQTFPPSPVGLTARELECRRLVALGCSDGEIARSLGISTSTAHQYVEGARKRLHAKTRAQMTARAVSLGMVDEA